jgi:hypothetical protein
MGTQASAGPSGYAIALPDCMRRFLLIPILLAACASAVPGQQTGAQAPLAGAPKVELKGKIEKIWIAAGTGMPSLEIRTGEKTTRVRLGSMRYLMEQDFRPKAGDEIAVQGYRVEDGVVAITVTCGGKTLRLRDEAGFPVWRGGRRGPPGRSKP